MPYLALIFPFPMNSMPAALPYATTNKAGILLPLYYNQLILLPYQSSSTTMEKSLPPAI